MNKNIDIGQYFSTAWNVFTMNAAPLVLSALVLSAFYLLNFIPIIGAIIVLIISPPLIGGYVTILLKAMRMQQPQVGDLFSQFNAFGKWWMLMLYWIVVIIVCMIPYGVFALLGILLAGVSGGSQSAYGSTVNTGMALVAAGLMGIGGLISGVLMLVAQCRWMFTYFLLADGEDPKQAFNKSAEMTEGIRWWMLLILILVGVVANVGVIACGVGMLASVPIAYLILASLYFQLRGEPLPANNMSGYAPPPPAPPQAPAPPDQPTPPPTDFGSGQNDDGNRS